MEAQAMVETAKPLSDGYWYLATPYTAYPDGIDAAFRQAVLAAARFVRAGHRIFSPICHSHPIALGGKIDPLDHGIWLLQDEPLMNGAVGMFVVQMPGWDVSKGVAFEIAAFRKAGKPVIFVTWPGLIVVADETSNP